MSTYFVKNMTQNPADTTQYPGIRIDASDVASAFNQFRNLTGAPVGDDLRAVLDGPNFIFFGKVEAGPPVVQSQPKPALPPIGS